VVDWIVRVIGSMGYPGVGMLMLLENLFPPVPSELIMPFAGMVATRGGISFWGVVAAGTTGSVLGALALYSVGRAVGEDRLKRWADEHGRWLALSSEDLEKGRFWFERHGGVVVSFGRMVPGIRSLISIPAGADRMSLPLFLSYTTLGSAAWTTLLAYLGRILGQNYRLVEQYLEPVSWVVLGSILVAFVIRVIRHKGRASSGCPERQTHGA
jgi:membrane protein DedA with SNARE-associated domain